MAGNAISSTQETRTDFSLSPVLAQTWADFVKQDMQSYSFWDADQDDLISFSISAAVFEIQGHLHLKMTVALKRLQISKNGLHQRAQRGQLPLRTTFSEHENF